MEPFIHYESFYFTVIKEPNRVKSKTKKIGIRRYNNLCLCPVINYLTQWDKRSVKIFLNFRIRVFFYRYTFSRFSHTESPSLHIVLFEISGRDVGGVNVPTPV